jgi:phage baseplate assembly protein W
MRPTFGSIIWDYLFEPFTDGTVAEIVENTREIVENDPRVNLQDIKVQEYEHGIKIEIELFYLGIDAAGTFEVTFDRRNSSQELTEDF